MEERYYVVQALLDRLQDEGVRLAELGEPLAFAVERASLSGMPRRVARFCQDIDVRLVQMAQPERDTWHFVLAWNDEVGRPRIVALKALGDYYRASRRLLTSDELLSRAPDVLFLHALVEAIEEGDMDDAHASRITSLWHAHPRAAIERIGRLWRKRRDIRLLAQAAKYGDWRAVRADLPRLRRGLRRGVFPSSVAALHKATSLIRPMGATVAFVGARNAELRERVVRDLAPAFPFGLRTLDCDYSARGRGIDVAVVVEPPEGYRTSVDEAIAVERAQPLSAAATEVQAALLQWLECRVERRYPQAIVGPNPLSARMLQFAVRHKLSAVADFFGTLLNSSIECRLRSPVLMPYPYGIVIHRNAVLGRRVSVMHQVTISSKHPSDPAAPVVEDNVFIGAGAKILGPVRIGRGATVGANAVVTRDVPSHCTVVGVNRILGAEEVAEGRRALPKTVVNT